MSSRKQCAAKTKLGNQCRNKALIGSKFCNIHQDWKPSADEVVKTDKISALKTQVEKKGKELADAKLKLEKATEVAIEEELEKKVREAHRYRDHHTDSDSDTSSRSGSDSDSDSDSDDERVNRKLNRVASKLQYLENKQNLANKEQVQAIELGSLEAATSENNANLVKRIDEKLAALRISKRAT